jgi:SAM-dependent methyltransferase
MAHSLEHRRAALGVLAGGGLEVGALHEPTRLGAGCRVEYFDAITEEQARALFPELPPGGFVHVDHVGDLDRGGLGAFADGSLDFVIMNHVLEHLANPLLAVREAFRVIRTGGVAVLSIPDMRFTFDARRRLTPWEHLWGDYAGGVTESSDEHYLDFLRSAAPHVFGEPPGNLAIHVARVRSRREHAHVWSSQSFREHLARAMKAFGVVASPVFESTGDENSLEYFSMWRKSAGPAPTSGACP